MGSSTLKEKLAVIRLIHFALIIGLSLFTGVVGYLINSGFESSIESAGLLSYTPYIVVLVAYPLATFLFKSNLKQIDYEAPLSKKIGQFSTAHIMQLAIFESGALFSAVISLLTANPILLAIPAVFILLMLLSTPSTVKLEQLISLTPEEKAELE